MLPSELIPENRALLHISEVLPCRHFYQERKPVSQGGIERFRTEVNVLRVIHAIDRRRWVHGRPSVNQPIEFDSLYPALMDDREELVLQFRSGAVDFIEEHNLCVPDGGGSADISQAFTFLVGNGKTDKVVVIDEAGIIKPVFEA